MLRPHSGKPANSKNPMSPIAPQDSSTPLNASASAPAPAAATLQLLTSLVGFDTVSRNSNLAMIEFIQAYLAQRNVVSRIIYDHDRRKANLFATIGAGVKPGIVLSGHSDVVPVDGQKWTSDPFVLTERDGKFYGRGACDMKAFIAITLSKVDAMLAAKLDAPFHLAYSYDEEVGCLGVHSLLDDLREQNIAVLGCIVGEPTNMQMKTGHKGKRAFRCTVKGRSAHSSMPDGAVNAIEYGAELVAFLKAQSRELQNSLRDHLFDVPYTTLSTTMFNGGIATNTIPAACEFVFEYRYLPGQDPALIDEKIQRFIDDVLLPQMNGNAKEAAIELVTCIDYPALDTPVDAEIKKIVANWAAPGDRTKVAFGTEAGLFSRSGIESVICGPGDIVQAHRPDEFVTAEQLVLCERFIDGLISEMGSR